MLRELDATAQPEADAGDALESNASAALLAAKLTRLACGVQSSLSGLILALPHDAPPRAALRAQLAAATERAHRLHAALASQAPNAHATLARQPPNGLHAALIIQAPNG
ncbi:uncharacterized protein LOC135084382 [Ostrinia nubilalis]